jgi:hypothetical protein
LHSFAIANWGLKSEKVGKLFVRIEVEPGTPAHHAANVGTGQFIRFSGPVLIDTHHGEKLIEVHPHDPMVAISTPVNFGPDTCKQGFVWREAVPSDHVCVTPDQRDQAKRDNAEATNRRQQGGGSSGPDTCRVGFVWREAFANDHVCVTPQTRARVAEDNRLANQRRVSR